MIETPILQAPAMSPEGYVAFMSRWFVAAMRPEWGHCVCGCSRTESGTGEARSERPGVSPPARDR